MHLYPIILTVLALCVKSSSATWEELDNLHFGGRWWRDNDSMKHSWGVGTFIVRFRGSSELVMQMTSSWVGAYYTCQVDGGPEVKLFHDNQIDYFQVAAGLSPSEEHIVRCGRNNEASWGPTIIDGIVLDPNGELLQAVDPNAENIMLRFEAIGDSITAGFKATATTAAEPSTIANQDVFQTYVRYMADAWGTNDYNVIAKSGVSILDYGTTGVAMSQEFPCREFWDTWQEGCPQLHDFSSWQADVVTINLGTNDFAFGDPTKEAFREGYLSFIQDVREKYPNALIACMEPILDSCAVNQPILTDIVDGLEQAVIDMNDEKVIYYETGSPADPWLVCATDYTDYTHPTVVGNEKFAARMLESTSITDDIRRFFPEKCGGTGASCQVGAPTAAVPTPSPVPITIPTTAIELAPTVIHSEESRLIAFVGNWQACPSDAQLAQYTHIVISFAVSYTWSPNKNICSQQCDIATPLTCGNTARPDLIQRWQEQGKKVLLSFGGAGMGGSWSGDVNDCWEYCYGKEEKVVDRLTDIVNEVGFDGIDIDYEYFYEDNQNGSGFTKGTQAQTFLRDITVGLRNKLPIGSELTHAPMEPDMEPGRGYFNVLKEIAEDTLDFLMPQYYNGYVRSYTNFPSALSHFTTITDQMFGGNPNKVVFGFCISDCGSFNLDGDQSAQVMEWLSEEYPCNGGAFFWVANDDTNGDWSKVVKDQLEIDSSTVSCSGGNTEPTGPTTPVVAPVSTPSRSPIAAVVNPTTVPVAPISTPVVQGSKCLAIPQAELPAGSWATNDAACALCGADYTWWPCDVQSPSPLCRCDNDSPPVNSPVSSPTSSPASPPTISPVNPTRAPVNPPTTSPANPPTSSPVNPPTRAPANPSTSSPVNLPTSTIVAGSDCTAIPQEELPSGTWATTVEYCALCETGNSHPWWPCDVQNPPLCRCHDDAIEIRLRRLGAPPSH